MKSNLRIRLEWLIAMIRIEVKYRYRLIYISIDDIIWSIKRKKYTNSMRKLHKQIELTRGYFAEVETLEDKPNV